MKEFEYRVLNLIYNTERYKISVKDLYSSDLPDILEIQSAVFNLKKQGKILENEIDRTFSLTEVGTELIEYERKCRAESKAQQIITKRNLVFSAVAAISSVIGAIFAGIALFK